MPEFMILQDVLKSSGGCGFHGFKFKEKKLIIHTVVPTDSSNDYPHLIIFTPQEQPRTEGLHFIINMSGYHYSTSPSKHYYRLLNQIRGTFKTLPETSDLTLAPEAEPICQMFESKLVKAIVAPRKT